MERYGGLGGGGMVEEGGSNLSRVPVFVFPATLYFNGRERDQMKQIMTIYNPYEFPIRFKVLSNAPDNYTVIDPEGSIKSKNCVDLILRVSEVPAESSSQSYVEHKFRVQIYNYSDRKIIGRRDVPSIIHWGNLPPHLAPSEGGDGRRDLLQESASFKQCPGGGAGSSKDLHHHHNPPSGGGGGGMGSFLPQGQQPNYVVILTAVLCVIGLILPLSRESCVRETSSSSPSSTSTSTTTSVMSLIPEYLHLSVNQKLLAAYGLGLVTMVIFRL